MINFSKNKKTGFTLIEMMVAVFVFSIVMVLATGAIFSIISANKTSQALKSVMDNLSSALDSMSREIRYGTVYHCGSVSSGNYDRKSCPEGTSDDTTFSFLDRNNIQVIYELSDHESILKCDAYNNCSDLTSSEVHVTNLHFYVQGAGLDESYQPQLLITISGYALAGTTQSPFDIETMVDQRKLDMCKKPPIVPTNLRPSTCP